MARDADDRAERLRALLRRPSRAVPPGGVQQRSGGEPRALRQAAQPERGPAAPTRSRRIMVYAMAGLLSLLPIVGLFMLQPHRDATPPRLTAPMPARQPAGATSPPAAAATRPGGPGSVAAVRHPAHATAAPERTDPTRRRHRAIRRRPSGNEATRRLNLRELRRVERRLHRRAERHRRRR